MPKQQDIDKLRSLTQHLGNDLRVEFNQKKTLFLSILITGYTLWSLRGVLENLLIRKPKTAKTPKTNTNECHAPTKDSKQKSQLKKILKSKTTRRLIQFLLRKGLQYLTTRKL